MKINRKAMFILSMAATVALAPNQPEECDPETAEWDTVSEWGDNAEQEAADYLAGEIFKCVSIPDDGTIEFEPASAPDRSFSDEKSESTVGYLPPSFKKRPRKRPTTGTRWEAMPPEAFFAVLSHPQVAEWMQGWKLEDELTKLIEDLIHLDSKAYKIVESCVIGDVVGRIMDLRGTFLTYVNKGPGALKKLIIGRMLDAENDEIEIAVGDIMRCMECREAFLEYFRGEPGALKKLITGRMPDATAHEIEAVVADTIQCRRIFLGDVYLEPKALTNLLPELMPNATENGIAYVVNQVQDIVHKLNNNPMPEGEYSEECCILCGRGIYCSLD